MSLLNLFEQCLTIPYSQVGISANYAIKRDDEILYIFFQDSKGSHDWKVNFDFPAKAYKRMGKTMWYAHRGFLKEWKTIEPMLACDIANKDIKKIIITGYSHGAAIAMLCHEYVWYNRPDLRDVIEGYGFGCPRVYWGFKTKNIRSRWEKFTVIRNINDLFTHLPPWIFGFSHVGKIIKIGRKHRYSMLEAHYAKNLLKELEALESLSIKNSSKSASK